MDKDEFLKKRIRALSLRNACKQINYELINLFEKNDEAWNDGLYGACEGGHVNLVNLAIENGANDLEGGLLYSCVGGHVNTVNLMIEKGANNWNSVLFYACQSGNMDIVNIIIKNGGNVWDSGLYGACQSGNIDIIKLMFEKGAKNMPIGLRGACFEENTENTDIFDLMTEKCKEHDQEKFINWDDCLACAIDNPLIINKINGKRIINTSLIPISI